jgi:SpoVK/Ycf46/Vps4 family AAA+-type ATPase
MPVTVKMVVPDQTGRLDILTKMLSQEKLDADVILEEIAERTDDFTGSDLRELVRVATLQRAKDVVKGAMKAMSSTSKSAGTSSAVTVQAIEITKAQTHVHMRPLKASDFEYSLSKTSKSGSSANDYAKEMKIEEAEQKLSIEKG